MSSALDPTADMAPLGKHRKFGETRKLQGRDISHTRTLTGETLSDFHGTRRNLGKLDRVQHLDGRIPAHWSRSQRLEWGALHLTRSISSVVVTAHPNGSFKVRFAALSISR